MGSTPDTQSPSTSIPLSDTSSSDRELSDLRSKLCFLMTPPERSVLRLLTPISSKSANPRKKSPSPRSSPLLPQLSLSLNSARINKNPSNNCSFLHFISEYCRAIDGPYN